MPPRGRLIAAPPLLLKVQDGPSKAGARERPRAAEGPLKAVASAFRRILPIRLKPDPTEMFHTPRRPAIRDAGAMEWSGDSNNKPKHNKDLEVVLEEKTDTEVI